MYERLKDPLHVKWAKAVKQRDNYICQICGKYGVMLNSHHLNSYDFFENQRYDINNGITLCEVHHNEFHDIFGRGKNTKFQFEQFLKTIRAYKKAIKKLAVEQAP